jgi:hypothetical protein
MSAKVSAKPEFHRFQGWCETCQDGVNGSRSFAEDWAEAHNRHKHPKSRGAA